MTSEPPISRFPVVPLADLPPDLQERFTEVADKSGFLPNVFAALAWRPDEARAFFALHDALMDKDTPGLTQADREVLVVATSAANGCLYCVVAHGALVRIRARDRYLADQVAVDWRKAPLPARLRAVVEVGVRLAVDPVTVTAEQQDALVGQGLTQDDVWDVGAIVALFALSNRLVHWAAVPPNQEFFLLGRVPRH
ncbi:peroxidase-related enzyme [Modestobacter altitudinis]|uniref:peroxidase-related enzyme n=1 Tax=Modestobacter altitudinis TaxID=2213158 RepID=UPI001FE8EB1C|nr:peroxidase-related enzyme [Modestobacter altitudinis]